MRYGVRTFMSSHAPLMCISAACANRSTPTANSTSSAPYGPQVMPSTPNPPELAGIKFPERPAQRRMGTPRIPVWRSRDLAKPYSFYCVGSIAFDDAIVDYETWSVIICGRRLLLQERNFALCVHLLWAEGDFLSLRSIADKLEVGPGPHTSTIINRLVRRLSQKFSLHGLDNLLERRPGRCRLIFHPTHRSTV